MAVKLVKRGDQIYYEDDQATPTSPMGASLRGANPDVAKMFGSSAQLANANPGLGSTPTSTNSPAPTKLPPGQSASLTPPPTNLNQQDQLRQLGQPRDLSTALREQQTSTTATADQTATLAEGQQLQNLSNLGNVNAQIAQRTIAAETAAIPGVDSNQNAALHDYLANPTSISSLQTALTAMGMTNPDGSPMKLNTAADVTNAAGLLAAKVPSLATALAGSVAQTVGSSVLLTDQDFVNLGFQDINQAAALLDTTPDALRNMNTTQLIQLSQSKIAGDFSTVANLQAQANDPTAGAAVRAEARAQLRQLGAVGIQSIDSSADRLADQIRNDDKINILDPSTGLATPVATTQLLNSDYITGLAAAYFNGTLDKAAFQASNPDIAKFFDANSEMIQSVVGSVSSDMANVAAANAQNLALASVAGGQAKLSDSVMKSIFPDWGTLVGAAYTPPPIFSVLNSGQLSASDAQNVAQNLALLQGFNPDMLQQAIGAGDVSTLNSMLLTSGATGTNSLAADINYAQQMQQGNISAIVGTDQQTMQNTIADAKAKAATGLYGSDPTDAFNQAVQTAQSSFKMPQNLSQLSALNPSALSTAYQAVSQYVAQQDVTGLATTFKDYLSNPSEQTFSTALSSGNLKAADLETMMNSGMWSTLNGTEQAAATAKLASQIQSEQTDMILQSTQAAMGIQTTAQLLQYPGSNPTDYTHVDSVNSTIQPMITALQDSKAQQTNATVRGTYDSLINQLQTVQRSLTARSQALQANAQQVQITDSIPASQLSAAQATFKSAAATMAANGGNWTDPYVAVWKAATGTNQQKWNMVYATSPGSASDKTGYANAAMAAMKVTSGVTPGGGTSGATKVASVATGQALSSSGSNTNSITIGGKTIRVG